VNILCVQETK
jgi:exonuclease III